MMNEDQTEKTAQAIAGKLKRAVNADLPLFILVYYDHEADKLTCIDALKQAVKQCGMNTRTFDPARHPAHGTGKLYPLLAAAVAEKCLCLISGLPLDEKDSLRADNELIHYLNIYRDRIPQEKIRMVLFLHSSHAEQFIHAAGDLWDFRHGIYHLERKPDEQRPALWETIEKHTARLSLSETEKKEIEKHIRKTRPVIDQTDDPVEKAGLLLDLTQWLFRHYAYAPAADAAFEALEHIKNERTKLQADIEHWLGYALDENGSLAEALVHYEISLEIRRKIGDKSGEGTTLNNMAGIYRTRGDYATALTYLEQSLEIRREIGDKSGEGRTLNNISQIYDARGDYATALTYLEQSLEIQKEIGDKSGEGTTLNNMATTAHARGDYATALTYLEQSLEIQREIEDKSGEGATLNNISQIYDARGDYATALTYLEQSLEIQKEIGDKSGEGTTLNNMATTAHARGDYATALTYLEQSLEIQREIEDKSGEGCTLNNISQIFKARGDYATALTYLEQSLDIRREIGDKSGEAVTCWNLGKEWERQGDIQKAVEYIRRCVEIEGEIGHPDYEKNKDYLEKLVVAASSS